MDNNIETVNAEIAEKIKPLNCRYCGSVHLQFEGSHFPRFFFSCKNCERRIELLYDWITRKGVMG